MNVAPQPPVSLGAGHCCVCTAGACHHIGPVMLCAAHSGPVQPIGNPRHVCPICGVLR